MKIGIMGAMIEEIFLLKDDIKNIKTETIGQRNYHTGQLYGIDSTLVFSRWGKVAASSTASTLITRYDVDCIIFTGVAGAIAKNLNVGDIIIGNKLYQHDMDARPIFKKHEIPLTNKIFFDADEKLLMGAVQAAKHFVLNNLQNILSSKTLQTFGINEPKVYMGTLGCGDQFIDDPVKTKSILQYVPDIMAVDMESGAVAQVCSEYNIPLVVIRTISDKADHSAAIDFQQFVSDVAQYYSKGIIENLLHHIFHSSSQEFTYA